MFDFFIAAMLGIGAGGWLFFNLNRSSGEANAASHALAGGVVGVIVAFVVFTLLKFVFNID
jgi:mannose/fructose/N-acetylgalactosamine-specific phosphotransferase system component IID